MKHNFEIIFFFTFMNFPRVFFLQYFFITQYYVEIFSILVKIHPLHFYEYYAQRWKLRKNKWISTIRKSKRYNRYAICL